MAVATSCRATLNRSVINCSAVRPGNISTRACSCAASSMGRRTEYSVTVRGAAAFSRQFSSSFLKLTGQLHVGAQGPYCRGLLDALTGPRPYSFTHVQAAPHSDDRLLVAHLLTEWAPFAA